MGTCQVNVSCTILTEHHAGMPSFSFVRFRNLFQNQGFFLRSKTAPHGCNPFVVLRFDILANVRVESRGVQTCPLLPGCIGLFRWFVYIYTTCYLNSLIILSIDLFCAWTTSGHEQHPCFVESFGCQQRGAVCVCLPWPATSDCFSPACCQSPTLSLAYASISDEGIVEATSKQGVLLLAERNIVTLAGGVQVPPWQSLCKVRSLDFGGLIPRKFGDWKCQVETVCQQQTAKFAVIFDWIPETTELFAFLWEEFCVESSVRVQLNCLLGHHCSRT